MKLKITALIIMTTSLCFAAQPWQDKHNQELVSDVSSKSPGLQEVCKFTPFVLEETIQMWAQIHNVRVTPQARAFFLSYIQKQRLLGNVKPAQNLPQQALTQSGTARTSALNQTRGALSAHTPNSNALKCLRCQQALCTRFDRNNEQYYFCVTCKVESK